MAQCTAHSSQSGERCRRMAIRGGMVCFTHGGSAAHVRKSADERLQAARDAMLEMLVPALGQVRRLINDPDVPEAVRGTAVRDLLDRVGLGATQKTEATVHTDGPTDMDREIARLVEALGAQPEAPQPEPTRTAKP